MFSAGGIQHDQGDFSTDSLEMLCDVHIPRLLRLLETGSELDLTCSKEEREIHEVSETHARDYLS
mgnify:CR=1 FL=1